jgi:elongation factor P
MERKPMEYLYSTVGSHVLMDMKTYEEVSIPADLIGDKAVYLTPNLEVVISLVDGKPIIAEMPNTVELVVIDTPPEVKSATVTNVMKEAACEGGAKIKVPPFIQKGTKVKVDTRTGEYMGKA